MALMVEEARGLPHLEEVLRDGKPLVLHFRAPWCEASKQMDVVFEQLCSETAPHARFLRVEAEEHPDISEKYSVIAVPYFVFIKNGQVVDTLEGANPSELATKVEALAPAASGKLNGGAPEEELRSKLEKLEPHENVKKGEEAVTQRLEKLVNSQDVMLFMKGHPGEPKCGFSRKVVGALEELGVPFASFDVLSDEEVRQGIKSFSNWPTFPQLYVKGELVGGCDIVLEMHQSGELKELMSDKGIKPDINSRLKKLIASSDTMLFMKGTPENPKCGFSNKVTSALRDEGIEFGSFDILRDEEVRQGLKTYSNWPTYPQLYHKGELIGGCDIILEMKENGELKEALAA